MLTAQCVQMVSKCYTNVLNELNLFMQGWPDMNDLTPYNVAMVTLCDHVVSMVTL